jgi:MoxR-like ATPase
MTTEQTATETSEFQEDLTSWQRAEFAIEHSNRVLLYGLPGTGKTYFGLTQGLNGKSSYRLACTEEMTEADLIGFWRREASGNLKWQEGVGIKAWREGARLLVDEVNRINGDVESKLMMLLDTEASASWQNPDTDEVVTPASGFTVVATMNGVPEDLAPAILDRMIVRCEVNTPNPKAINALPEYLRSLATSLTDTDASHRYSLRSFVEFHRMYEASKNLRACAQVVFPEVAESVVDSLAIASAEGR